MSKVKLKPCPQCGIAAARAEHDENCEEYRISCVDIISCGFAAVGKTLEEAAECWNRRDDNE